MKTARGRQDGGEALLVKAYQPQNEKIRCRPYRVHECATLSFVLQSSSVAQAKFRRNPALLFYRDFFRESPVVLRVLRLLPVEGGPDGINCSTSRSNCRKGADFALCRGFSTKSQPGGIFSR